MSCQSKPQSKGVGVCILHASAWVFAAGAVGLGVLRERSLKRYVSKKNEKTRGSK